MTDLTLPSLPVLLSPASPEPLLPRFPSTTALDADEAARVLLLWLDKVGHSPLSADTLLLSLQAARTTGSRLQNRLDALARERSPDDAGAGSQLQALALQLEIALHQGYKRLAMLRDRSSGGGWLSSSKPRMEALALALDSAWQLQLYFTRHHAQLPDGFWLDCHQLYAHIAAKNWAQKTVGEPAITLAARYAAILLTGLIASNGMDQASLNAFIPLMQEEARHLQLLAATGELAEEGGFVFSSAGDTPPRFITDWPARKGPGPWWQLDLAVLLERLQARLQALPEPVSQIELQLLLQLQQNWRHPARRRHRRRRRLESNKLRLLSSLPDCWAALAAETKAATGEDATVPAPELHIVDLSLSGVQLQGEGRLYHIQPGEVVLISSKPRHWRCGIVRRINSHDAQTWYGIEYMGKQPQAVEIRPDNSLGTSWQQAIMLKGSLRHSGCGVLLLEGRAFNTLRPFIIRHGTQETAIQATRLLMQNSHYQLFEYKNQ
ncbi:hypothetical protein [Craterilacuibacter sp. RT1T]|uniref:hypothetical protein n=1 Tax=Craterilacuibacter sp. RT1T TaxID=2942211 RepID=UPI0020BE6FAD|nr:hypothetical protein [Craterilacuibacter sp. RT1T]MCL6262249.1 hypothetical protein [Craterilacuibacter sp. RT1T]